MLRAIADSIRAPIVSNNWRRSARSRSNDYGKEYAPEVERYVPLAMNLLRPLLDTLPNPVLTLEEEDEKVTVDE